MVNQMHKGISTLFAVIFLGLAIISGVVFSIYPRHSGFMLSDYPATINSGEDFKVTVTAVDQTGKPFPSYTGPVYFTSTDTNAIIPDPGTQSNPYTFVSSDNGVHTFNGFRLISIDSNESYTITISDGKNTETSNPITVHSQPTLHHFELNPISSPQTAGFDFTIKVEAVDQYGNTLANYYGAPTLTYSEGSINPNTVTSWSNGVGTATVKVTDTGTNCTITAKDALTTGTSNPFDVTSASSSSFIVDAKAWINVEEPFTVSVVAIDQSGNVEQSYLGTIHFSSDDESAILPDDYAFVSNDYGFHMFPLTLTNPKTTTITVTDVLTPSRKGSVTRDIHKQMPSFVGFGYGAATGPSMQDSGTLNPTYPHDLQANDLILMQVVSPAACMPSVPAGFSLLYGPDKTGIFNQWIFYKFATGSESGFEVIFNYPGPCLKEAVMFAFRGVASTDFVESGGFNYGNNTLIEAQSVTTTGNNRLAVSFVFTGHFDSMDEIKIAFIGSSGGVWTSEHMMSMGSSATLYGLSQQLQVAPMSEMGTISGGTILMTKSGYWGVRAFALIP